MKKNKFDETILKQANKFKKEYSKVLKAIKKYDRIAIFRHIIPDFDALGTQYGLYHWLKDNFPEKEIICLGDNHVTFTPRLYKEMDRVNDDWFKTPFLAIIVDCGNSSRIADPRFKKAKLKIKIDHHPDVENYAKISIVDDLLSSCSELVSNMLLTFKGDYFFSKEAAFNFYTGIAGDSGRFLYSSTSPHTFEIAKILLQTGIDLSKLYQKMYVKKIDDLYVTAYILNHFNISPHGVAYYVLDQETLEKFNITTERGKENVNIFSNIDGINAWCSITEDKKDNCFRVSIRSKETPINGVAAMFEGGGHAQASGAKLNSLQELPSLIDELDKLFR